MDPLPEFPLSPGPGFQKRLADRGIMIGSRPAQGPMNIQVNETILRRSPEAIADELVKAFA
jgi:hypothetical protein